MVENAGSFGPRGDGDSYRQRQCVSHRRGKGRCSDGTWSGAPTWTGEDSSPAEQDDRGGAWR
jgi:hypothetical protein